MNEKKGTVFIIDDDSSIRRSLSLFLLSNDYNVETYSSSEEYLERESFDGTGCLLLDINLGGKSGLQLQTELLTIESDMPIIFITGHGNVRMSVETLKKGALNFLEKPFKDEELLDAISEAFEVSQNNRREKGDILRAQSMINSLTPRETEILKYLVTGMLNKQIAFELKIAEHTVKLHRHCICKKLGVKSVPEIMRIADKSGILAKPKPKPKPKP